MSYEQDVMQPWSLHEIRVLGDVTVAIRRSVHGMWSVTRRVKDGPVTFMRVEETGAAADLVSRALEGAEDAWLDLALMQFPRLEDQA